MPEPVRNDAEIITGIFGPKPEDPAKQAAYANATGKVAQACKRAREDERRKVADVVQAAADTVSDKLNEAHAKELKSLALHMHDTVRDIKGASFWRGVGLMGIATVALCAATGFGVSFFLSEAQMNAVAITQAATRPSAEAMRDSMQRQDGGGFRP